MSTSTPSDRQPRRLAFVEAVTRGKDCGLVLADDAGSSYLLGVDQAVVEAIRTVPVSKKQTPQPAAGAEATEIGPREIQALIRGGMSAAEVAEVHGLDLARAQRYEGPVLAERAWMADRAQQTELRRPEGAQSLGSLVSERLSARGDDLASLEWDAWRRDDHRWVVEATWLALGTQLGDDAMASARWVFDPVGHTIVPEDAAARVLVEDLPKQATGRAQAKRPAGGDPYVPADMAEGDDLTALARATEVTAAAAKVAEATPEPTWTPVVVEGGKSEPDISETLVAAAEPDDVVAPAARELTSEPVEDVTAVAFEFEGVDEVPAPVTAVDSAEATPAKKAKKAARSRIPSWDEILLGTQGNADPS
ncbi:MAG: DUF3071 domain-containing protein [Actinomycetales bacterium]|nr:DUF3071 domain-containing protein [Actinomycetales bacterium]